MAMVTVPTDVPPDTQVTANVTVALLNQTVAAAWLPGIVKSYPACTAAPGDTASAPSMACVGKVSEEPHTEEGVPVWLGEGVLVCELLPVPVCELLPVPVWLALPVPV